MNIVISGAGQVGSSVAESPVSESNDITIVDTDCKRLRWLQDRLDLRAVAGNAALPSLLAQARAADAELLIAVTQSDQTDLCACRTASTLCSFTTCSGSTGGGIKMIRAHILLKHVFREILRAPHPTAVRPIKVGGKTMPSDIVFAALAYGFMYMVIVATLTLTLSFTGMESDTAFSAVVAPFNNTGPGLN